MIVFPAIDLKDGACVRLRQGEMDRATVFNDNPAGQARAFAEAGFAWLHVVDLDGAFAGRPANEAAVRAILAATDRPVQLGGGIRTRTTAEAWLAAGVRRVVLGTVAVRDPDLVRGLAADHPGRVVVGIDARQGMVAVEGWAEATEMPVHELALAFEDAGVAAIVYTDIERDGVLGGPNVAAAAALARAVSTPVVASGGVAGAADIAALRDAGAGIAGVIVGRALYDGRIAPAEALAVAEESTPC
jgi:phosphoribosylformimino-5-aminoimidazole carboxamide ribotide isomerase